MRSPLESPVHRLSDPALRPDRRQARGGRAARSIADGLALFDSPDLLGVGALADAVNRAQARRQSSRSRPTSTSTRRTSASCARRASSAATRACRRKTARIATRSSRCWPRRSPRATALTKRVPHRRRSRHEGGPRVLHDDVSRAQARHSRTCTSRRSRRSRSRTSRASRRCRGEDVLIALREAGLDTMPGGGAETFSAAVREQIADKKLGGADYIDVHRTAHRLGIRSNCTMLYGHVETHRGSCRRISRMLRELQDETGGFLAYIPLAYHPDDNELGDELGRAGHRDDRLRRPAQPRRRPAVPRQLRAHQDALDHGHAVRCRRRRWHSASTTWKEPWSARRSITRSARTRRRG